jgi:hypothetical protein
MVELFMALSLLTDFQRPTLSHRLREVASLHTQMRKVQFMKTDRSEDHHEATKALALALAGVIAIMLIWNLVMLVLY